MSHRLLLSPGPSAMPLPPVRTTLHRASEAEVQAQNEAWASEGARVRITASLEVLLQRAAALQKAGPAQMRPYAEHPDERVPLALLGNPAEPWGRHGQRLGGYIFRQARARAEAEGVLWTPLLDALDRAQLWPHSETLSTLREERGEKAPAGRPSDSGPWNLLQPLHVALRRSEGEEEAISLLKAFSGPTLRRGIARHAFPGEQMEAFVFQHPELLADWVANPRLAPEQRQRCLDWMRERLHPESVDRLPSADQEAALAILQQLSNRSELQSELTPALLDSLLAILPLHPPPPLPRTLEERDQARRSLRRRLQSALVHIGRHLSAEQRLALYPQVRDQDHLVVSLIHKPENPPELLRQAHRDHSRTFGVRLALARHPLSSADPEIGARLASRKGEVQDSLLQQGLGAGFRAALLAHQERDTEEAAKLAWRRLPEVWPALQPGDLARAARSRVPRIQEAARRVERLLLCLHSTAEAFQETFERVLAEAPRDVRRLLELLPPERFSLLPRATLSALLALPDAEVRLEVMRRLGAPPPLEAASPARVR